MIAAPPQPRNTEGPERLVLVAGASGSGKSSLVRAGVIPRLGHLDQPWVSIPSFKPGDRPLKGLAQALCEALRRSGREVDWRECGERLAREPDALAGYVDDLLTASGVV